MTVAGIGIDAVEIKRFQKAVESYGDSFLKKIFTSKEMEYAKTKKAFYMHMSGKFAAKEAVKKALPDGIEIGLKWSDIEILNSEDGKPFAVLHGNAKRLMEKFNLSRVFVSISHTETIATANAMAVENGA